MVACVRVKPVHISACSLTQIALDALRERACEESDGHLENTEKSKLQL